MDAGRRRHLIENHVMCFRGNHTWTCANKNTGKDGLSLDGRDKYISKTLNSILPYFSVFSRRQQKLLKVKIICK